MKIHLSYLRTPELHISIFIQQQQVCRAHPPPGKPERGTGPLSDRERPSVLLAHHTLSPGAWGKERKLAAWCFYTEEYNNCVIIICTHQYYPGHCPIVLCANCRGTFSSIPKGSFLSRKKSFPWRQKEVSRLGVCASGADTTFYRRGDCTAPERLELTPLCECLLAERNAIRSGWPYR